MKILQFPLTKVLIGFLFGIILFRMETLNATVMVCFSIGFLLNAIGCHRFYTKVKHFKFLFGGLVLFLSITLGYTTALLHTQILNPKHYLHQIDAETQPQKLRLLLTEKLKNTAKNQRYLCVVQQVDNHESQGKILLNISKKDTMAPIAIGSQLLVTGTVYQHSKPFNPNVFDYGKYLEYQGIYAQIYTQKNKVALQQRGSGVTLSFAKFREKIIKNLESSAIAKTELNVLKALLLGQQQDIDTNTLKDYQYAGAVHILSVSGLHVGIIMMFINFLLQPFGNSKKGSYAKVLIIILSLWSLSLLTGMSASIVRSVTMFSFLAIGLHLRRTVNMYHTLLVSMLLILLFKPSFLYDVGFQLSYLALFFIVWLQPFFAMLWTPKNKIVSYFWNIITVSFAAQIGTMPLSIYYFHQFPGLFFITNLLILPLLGIIMAVGILATLIAIFNTVPVWVVQPLELLLRILNGIIHNVAALDNFVIKNISFSKEMLWSSYLVILLTFLWFKRPYFKKMVFAFGGIIALQLIFIFQKKENQSQQELIIFNSKKATLIAERIGEKATIYSDSLQKNWNQNLILQSYLVGSFCSIGQQKPLPNMMYFKHQKILVIDSLCLYTPSLQPDIVLLRQSPKLNLLRLLKTIKPKMIVADGSNYKSYAKHWEATCQKEKIPFHYTDEKGFYKL